VLGGDAIIGESAPGALRFAPGKEKSTKQTDDPY
jgi:hypothetical protein